MKTYITIFLLCFVLHHFSYAQRDSALQSIKQSTESSVNIASDKTGGYVDQVYKTSEDLVHLPDKYLKKIGTKIFKYNIRITGKTEKTLTKLSKWESKIHKLLLKANPEVAKRLFSNSQMTFASLLQKIKKGEELSLQYQTQYNQYRDNLTTSLKYLKSQKEQLKSTVIKPIETVNKKMDELTREVDKTEAIEAFIKERKKQLFNESLKYIGNSKYIKKINKEAYYYVETLRNYKQLFSEPAKVEKAAIDLLNKIPEFKEFMNKNSGLSALGGVSSFSQLPPTGTMPIVNGLANRSSLQQFIKTTAPYVNLSSQIQQIKNQLTDAKSPLSEWKNKLSLASEGIPDIPDFKPNMQKTKTFKQRLEYGSDLQFGKNINYLPATASIALKIGYKLNDKSSIGVGINYLAGLGNGWDNLKLSSQGIGLRTYLKWKIKKGLDLQGGGEWNYMTQFKSIAALRNADAWQRAALIGLSKPYKVSKKVGGNIQFLYDFLSKNHVPNTSPFVFRFGYSLK